MVRVFTCAASGEQLLVPAVVERLQRHGEVETPSAEERQQEENESSLQVGWVAGNVRVAYMKEKNKSCSVVSHSL